MDIKGISPAYYIYSTQPLPVEPHPPSERIVIRDNPEAEAVRAFLNGKVPERGSNVVELVNKMVF